MLTKTNVPLPPLAFPHTVMPSGYCQDCGRLVDPRGCHNGQTYAYLDSFTRGYLEAALWTSDPWPMSGEWSESDEWCIDAIDPDSLTKAIEDCEAFQRDNRADLDEVSDTYHTDDSQHGHDFWLTRNGHGVGFWDRGYDDELAERLSKAARACGERWIHGPDTDGQGLAIGEWDGVIYIE